MGEGFFSRGFFGRRRRQDDDRLPGRRGGDTLGGSSPSSSGPIVTSGAPGRIYAAASGPGSGRRSGRTAPVVVMTTGTFRVVSEKVFVNDIDSTKFPLR